MLDAFGFTADERPACSSRSTSSTRSGRRASSRSCGSASTAAASGRRLEAFINRPMTMEYNPYGERQIRKLLPADAPDEIVAHLVGIGEAVAAARPAAHRTATSRSSSTRSSCAGWATTPARSSSSPTRRSTYSLGGGGRYDGMIGRFLGQDVPAVGLLDRVRAHRRPRRGGRGCRGPAPSSWCTIGMCRSGSCSRSRPRWSPRARGCGSSSGPRTSRRCSSARHPTATPRSRPCRPASDRESPRDQAARLSRRLTRRAENSVTRRFSRT